MTTKRFFLEQNTEPLFPEVIWSRPETKRGAGKLLIIGGSVGAMSHVAADYAAAEQAGVGTIHLLVPDSLAKVTSHIPHINYAPSTPSGSFSQKALAELTSCSQNVDGVLLSGDMGKNSETSLMLEKFIDHYEGLLFVTSESIESFAVSTHNLATRHNTTLFLNFAQLQTLGTEAKLSTAFSSDMVRSKLAENLHTLSTDLPGSLVVKISDETWIARQGRVAACNNQVSSAVSAVWQLQQPTKPFEALSSSLAT